MPRILVTGAAGFIGFHVCGLLLARGDEVIGLDNLNDYYDVGLKRRRLALLAQNPGFTFLRAELADREEAEAAFARAAPELVVHLGAQAGVRYSITHPHAYASSNLTGFLHVLEGCRTHAVRHLVYASTSSVYGAATRMPFAEEHSSDHPLTLYAATKKANEAMAHAYSHLFGIPMTGLRYFTVYGPWGRPDMAPGLFAKAIAEGAPLQLFNHGRMSRDFTYVDDVAEGTVRVLDSPAKPDPAWSGVAPLVASSSAPWRVYNIGNGRPTELLRFVELLEQAFGRNSERVLLPMQPGDVPATWADVRALEDQIGFRPTTTIEVGTARFVQWYREYYCV